MTTQKTLGEIINNKRLEKDMSLRDLATKVDVSYSYISRLERDKYIPSKSVLEKIADTLDIDKVYLLRIAGYHVESDGVILEKEFPEGVTVLRRASKELSPEAKAVMLKLMKAFLEESN